MGHGSSSHNTRLVGSHDLQGRTALQITVRGKWCYVGHLPGTHANPLTGEIEHNGTSILDVSKPENPVLAVHIPGRTARDNHRAVQVITSRHDGRDYLIRNNESEGKYGFEVFDISERAKPRLVSEITDTPRGPLTHSHKGWWDEASGLYFASAGEPGFRWGGHLVIWDLANPHKPKFVSRHWINGQLETEPESDDTITLHHPIVDMANKRVYLGYPHGCCLEVVDISDITKPRSELKFSISPTFSKGPHTVMPLHGVNCPNFAPGVGDVRDFILFVNEANNARPDHKEVRTMLYMLDVTARNNPMTVDTFRVPDAGYVERGGRFGPHQFAETQNGALYSPKDNRNLIHLAYFSAGLRILDISDPYGMKEVGYYLPETTANTQTRAGSLSAPIGQVVQTNDVDLDERGLAYISDRACTGMHIVEYLG